MRSIDKHIQMHCGCYEPKLREQYNNKHKNIKIEGLLKLWWSCFLFAHEKANYNQEHLKSSDANSPSLFEMNLQKYIHMILIDFSISPPTFGLFWLDLFVL